MREFFIFVGLIAVVLTAPVSSESLMMIKGLNLCDKRIKLTSSSFFLFPI
jgi:hypothetical protein